MSFACLRLAGGGIYIFNGVSSKLHTLTHGHVMWKPVKCQRNKLRAKNGRLSCDISLESSMISGEMLSHMWCIGMSFQSIEPISREFPKFLDACHQWPWVHVSDKIGCICIQIWHSKCISQKRKTHDRWVCGGIAMKCALMSYSSLSFISRQLSNIVWRETAKKRRKTHASHSHFSHVLKRFVIHSTIRRHENNNSARH